MPPAPGRRRWGSCRWSPAMRWWRPSSRAPGCRGAPRSPARTRPRPAWWREAATPADHPHRAWTRGLAGWAGSSARRARSRGGGSARPWAPPHRSGTRLRSGVSASAATATRPAAAMWSAGTVTIPVAAIRLLATIGVVPPTTPRPMLKARSSRRAGRTPGTSPRTAPGPSRAEPPGGRRRPRWPRPPTLLSRPNRPSMRRAARR